MSASLNNFTAPDAYSEGVGFLRCQSTIRVRLAVFNQAVFWRRGFGAPGGSAGTWEAEEELPVGRWLLADRCDFIQVRAAIPAAAIPAGSLQAQVSIATRTRADY